MKKVILLYLIISLNLLHSQEIRFQIDSLDDERYQGHRNWNYFKFHNVGIDFVTYMIPSGGVRFVYENSMSSGFICDTLCLRRPADSFNYMDTINYLYGCRAINNYIDKENSLITANLIIKTDDHTLSKYGTNDTLLIFKSFIADTIDSNYAYYKLKKVKNITTADFISTEYISIPIIFNIDSTDYFYHKNNKSKEIALNFSIYWTGKGNFWVDEIIINPLNIQENNK